MSRSIHDGRRRDGAPDDALLAPLDGRAGPARRLAPAVSAEMVRAVLERALEAPVELASDPPPPREARPWRRALALAAAILLAASVGSGASAVALRLVDIELGEPELAPEPPAPPRAERRPAAPAPRAPAPEVEVPAATVEPQPAPPAARPHRKRKVHVVIEAPPPAPVAAPAPQTVVPENLPPADLLAFANDRRARGAWRDADLFYRAAVSRFPGTDAAVVAAVASASLHLQHLGDPAGALDGYRRTLETRPSGTVAEEARWGVAEAQRALGRGDAEARALREFLAHHPGSALAPAAERRLRRLGR